MHDIITATTREREGSGFLVESEGLRGCACVWMLRFTRPRAFTVRVLRSPERNTVGNLEERVVGRVRERMTGGETV